MPTASSASAPRSREGAGRVGSEVLGITIWSYQDLEQLLRGFNVAYNARRQRALEGKAPDQVVAERLKAGRWLANANPHGRAGPEDIAKARLIAEAATATAPMSAYDGRAATGSLRQDRQLRAHRGHTRRRLGKAKADIAAAQIIGLARQKRN